jgi:hypothetical protein
MSATASKWDGMCTWVYGKVEPGWYMARGTWSADYAEDLRRMGYTVVAATAFEKPKQIPEGV